MRSRTVRRTWLGHEFDGAGDGIDFGETEGFGGSRHLMRHAFEVRDRSRLDGDVLFRQTGEHLRDFRLGAGEKTQRQRVLRHLRRARIT